MRSKLILALLPLAIMVQGEIKTDSVGILHRLTLYDDAISALPQLLYENAAFMPDAHPVSLGNLHGEYLYRYGFLSALDTDPDRGLRQYSLSAEAYIHTGVHTVWGNAAYINGRQINRQWCECADYNMVYPYVQATPSGGDLHREQYTFGGGWAGPVSNRFSLGATLGYEAGIYYRRIDPRPRNVTGNLRLSFGAVMHTAPLFDIGMSFGFNRYTQSSDILFLSEMGHDPIYHLTGLGTHYARFDGLGSNMNYTGYTFSGALQLKYRQAYAAVTCSRLTMRDIIPSLNKLPIASLWQNTLRTEAGWSHRTGIHSLGTVLHFEASRRHGTENIFGDPAASVYPQIAALEMFADNRQSASMSLLYAVGDENLQLCIYPSARIYHHSQVYRSPLRRSSLTRMNLGMRLRGDAISGLFAHRFTIEGNVYIPTSNTWLMPITDQEPNISLDNIYRYYHKAQSSALQTITVTWRSACRILNNYALAMEAGWHYGHSAANNANFNVVQFSFKLYF